MLTHLCSLDVDARSFLVGELFSIPDGSPPSQSTNKTMLIPSYRFEDDGKLMGWKLCCVTSGFVTLQVCSVTLEMFSRLSPFVFNVIRQSLETVFHPKITTINQSLEYHPQRSGSLRAVSLTASQITLARSRPTHRLYCVPLCVLPPQIFKQRLLAV